MAPAAPPSIDQQIALLERRAERILSVEDLRTKLARSAQTHRPMRIKLGMDPTAPDVTLGHAVPLRVIRQFQGWGHKAVLIIGDYTARVGDPSGVNTTRPMLSAEQIAANAKTYVAQIGKVLLSGEKHLEVRYNSEWLGKMNLLDIIRLAARKTVGQMLERDSFKERYEKGVEIRLHEFLYPLMQGWDSVMIEADVEMGGADQLFNNLVGRELQRDEEKEPQVVIVTPLLVGTDGTMKMSKSKGNYIGVTDPPSGPQGMFGKVMSLPDNLMESYYTLLTDLPAEEFKSQIAKNPRDAKVHLAKEIIRQLHDDSAAATAEAEFKKVIVGHQAPEQMPELTVTGPTKLAPLLVQAGFAASNGEAIRKMREGAVKIDGEKVQDPAKDWTFSAPAVLQLGNRRFVRIKPA
jgi:tyrosyl-tRNA synthetase